MDCKDLMIYDYIKYNGVTKIVDAVYLYSVSVHDPSEEWSISEAKTYSIDDIEPIELTEDILVKNGFEKSTRVGTYELNTDYYEIEVWDYSDGLWVVKVQYIEFSSLPYSQATITHVHALQHLLRLCGIDMELTI